MSPVRDREQLTRQLRRLFAATILLVLVSVGAGTFMLSAVIAQFGHTVDAAQEWTPRITRFASLGDSVADIGEVSTNLFVSRSAAVEEAELVKRTRAYDQLITEARQDLSQSKIAATPIGKRLSGRLDALDLQVNLLKTRTAESIGFYGRGERTSSSRSLALVSFHVSKAHEVVAGLVADSLQAQTDALEAGHRSSARVRAFAIPLALGGIASVVGIGAMLKVLAKRLTRLAKERESMLGALERSTVEANAFVRKLAESNRDLTDFAHVASHDLQEPLRKIIAFGDRLEKRCGAQLGDDGREYLDRMQNAAARMQTLIEDLLTFSRVTTRGEPFVPTDVRGIVEGVLGDLEVAIERAAATVEIGPLPHVEADPSQLRQLMQNLIGNALKFRNPDVATMITVEGRLVTGQRADELNQSFDFPTRWWDLEVRDNGIGFDQKYAEKIFTVFQRLHGRSEFEGSGIGLSVCRRIAERHRGSINAVSTPGRGTTFTVTLPEAQQQADALLAAQSTAPLASSATTRTTAPAHLSDNDQLTPEQVTV